jgi:ketosteroid isomerase-like protein
MKRVGAVLVMAVLAVGLVPVYGEEKGKASDDVKALDAKLTEAIQSGDVKTLDKYIADDFLVVDPLGRTHTKKSYLAHFDKTNAKFDSLKETDVVVRVFGDTAVVTGLLHIKGMIKDKDVSGEYRWTRVYNKKGDDWQCVAEQHIFVHPKE